MTGGPKGRPAPASERTAAEANPTFGAKHAPMEMNMPREEGVDVPPLVVPMTAADDRKMRERLHRNPEELLEKQLHNLERRRQHQETLAAAAPEDTLEDLATGHSTRPAAPRVPGEDIVPNMAEDKFHQVQTRGTTSEPAEGVHQKGKALRGYGAHHS